MYCDKIMTKALTPSETKLRWIPIEEGVPSDREPVFIWLDGEVRSASLHYTPEEPLWMVNGEFYHHSGRIRYWMPIPVHPEGEKTIAEMSPRERPIDLRFIPKDEDYRLDRYEVEYIFGKIRYLQSMLDQHSQWKELTRLQQDNLKLQYEIHKKKEDPHQEYRRGFMLGMLHIIEKCEEVFSRIPGKKYSGPQILRRVRRIWNQF